MTISTPEVTFGNDFPNIDMSRCGTPDISVVGLTREGPTVLVVTRCLDVENNVDLKAKQVAYDMRLTLGLGESGIAPVSMRRVDTNVVEQTWRLTAMSV